LSMAFCLEEKLSTVSGEVVLAPGEKCGEIV
jgi:hypothetical protein